MMRKIAFAILAIELGLFVVSRVGGLPAKIAADGAVAWAQDSTPAVDEPAQDDSAVTSPSQKSCIGFNQDSAPPDFRGSWCGSLDDNQLGFGTINLAIKDVHQHRCRGRLSGTWTDDFGASGTLKGMKDGDIIVVTLKPRGSNCRFAVNGTLVSDNEITGNYSIFGCKGSGGGTFDLTHSGC